jgi:Amt family ammonium transporter
MPDNSLIIASLALLVPLGYALIASGGLPEERARHATLGLLAAMGLTVLGYVGAGFALQFGGVGLVHEQPGYEELIWEWSALGPMWGAGWGMAGLTGWGMTGAASTGGAYALALANLPWVITAATIPLVSLRGRIPAWATGLIGLLVGALIYPLAGNWIWGGGWLANLGANLGLGHGLLDAGGSGLVHLLGASVALAGILGFTSRLPHRRERSAPVPLPPVHLPMLAVLGAGLLLVGSLSWTVANPLIDWHPSDMNLPLIALNGILAAAAGGLLPLLYVWFVAGVHDPLMATRGFAAGAVAVAAAAPFIPPWAALAIGAVAGLLVPLVIFLVDHILRWDDPTAALTVHGLAGALGLLAAGVFADGRFGRGWNGIGAGSYLGVARQGVTGLLAGISFRPDWPAQIQAQAVGVAALVLFAFFVAWVATVPLAVLFRLLGQMNRRKARTQEAPAIAGVAVTPAASSPEPRSEPQPDEAPAPATISEADDPAMPNEAPPPLPA